LTTSLISIVTHNSTVRALSPGADIQQGADGRRGTSDPYLVFAAAGASTERTETLWNNLNPQYGRTIELNFDPDGEVRE